MPNGGSTVPQPRAIEGPDRNILVVDDHGLVRAGLVRLIRMNAPGVRVVEAAGYDDALAAIARESFEIVYLDLDLREQRTGMQLLSHIRAHDIPTKVVILSALDDYGTVVSCIEAGAAGYIAKSSEDEAGFSNAMAVILKGGIYISPVSRAGAQPPRLPSPGAGREVALSPRQAEVLHYLCQGLSNKGIAHRLGISEGTVRKSYVSELFRLFGVARRTELIIEMARRGLTLASRYAVGGHADEAPTRRCGPAGADSVR